MTITALIVEDDDWVRTVIVEALTDAEIDVLEAIHAEEALETLNVQANGIDVLVTDVSMPGGMNGLALARHVAEHWNWIGILILSARPQSRALMPPNSHFLAKPFSPFELVEYVRALVSL